MQNASQIKEACLLDTKTMIQAAIYADMVLYICV